MRTVNSDELFLIHFLMKTSKHKVHLRDHFTVFEIGFGSRTIRASYVPKGNRVGSVSRCEFMDVDNALVIVTLLVSEANEFAELDFWKVTDDPIIQMPKNESYLFKAISLWDE